MIIKTRQDYVYIITDGEYQKIGVGYDPIQRIKQCQIGNARLITLIHAIRTDDMYTLEAHIHKALKMYNIRGEWFLLPDQIIEYLCQYDILNLISAKGKYRRTDIPSKQTLNILMELRSLAKRHAIT